MIAEASFISIVIIMVAFYLITIRPGQQEQKRQQQTIRDLREGDEIETTAGFLGTVGKIETPEDGPVQITIDFGNGMEIRALSTSVLRRISSADERVQQQHEEAPQAGEIPEEARKA